MAFKKSLISGIAFCLFTVSIYSYDPAARFDAERVGRSGSSGEVG
ncbi:hypothetical protein LEP1GSC027_3324 [Leptospira interrogans str. 2002000624]|nr:hypothetical protein LEP1GSC027_3324 [Leptospira interrogans str. 2002000624]